MNRITPSQCKILGWCPIFLIGGPVLYLFLYVMLYAIVPSANPNLILFPLILFAALVVGLALLLGFIERKHEDAEPSPQMKH